MALTIDIEGYGVLANADSLLNDTGGNGTGDWKELGGGTISLNPDVPLYGSSSIGSKYASKSGWTYYDRGTGMDFTPSTGTYDGQFIYMWILIQSKSAFDTLANKGFTIRVGSGTTDYREYKIAGTNDANGWNGKWKCFVIDPTKAGSVADTGTFDISSIQMFGVWIDTVVSVRADSIFLSQIAIGSGLRITGTSTTGWKDVVDYCTDLTNRAWGMFEEREGIYYCKGKIYIGDTGQTADTSFTDSGRTIQFETSEYYNISNVWASTVPIDAFGIVIEDNATYKTTFSDGVIVGTDNGRSGSSFIGNINENISLDLYGGNNALSVTTLYGTSLKAIYGTINSGNDSDHKFLGTSFADCSQFNPVGAPVIRNCTFAETADVDAALLWNENIDIQYSSFIANTTGAAIEMPSSAGTPYTFSNLSFSGNTFDVLNSSGSAFTVGKDGSDPTTSEGSAVTYTATFVLTLTNIPADTQVTIVNSSTRTELQNSTSTGVDITYSHSGGEVVDILLMHLDYDPNDSDVYSLTLDNANQSIKFALGDDRNYDNPVFVPSNQKYKELDAADIFIEGNSVGGNWANGGNGTWTSASDEYYDGAYSLKYVAGDGAYERSTLTFNVTSGKTYDISVWAKQGQGTEQELKVLGLVESWNPTVDSTTWTEYSNSFTCDTTGTATLEVHAIGNPSGATGDTIWVDKISITEN